MFPNITDCSVNECNYLSKLKRELDLEDQGFDNIADKKKILDQIKYVAAKLDLNYLEYLYSNSSCKGLLHRAISYGDLKGYMHLATKCNVSYPEGLYSCLSLEIGLDLAVRLYDLKGIEYLLGNNYFHIYSAYPNDKVNTLYLAVKLNDYAGIRYLLKNSIKENIDSILQLAYYNEQFEIAELLLNNHNTNFYIRDAVRVNPIRNTSFYIKHLEYIHNHPNISHRDYQYYHHFIKSIFNNDKSDNLISSSVYSDDPNAYNKILYWFEDPEKYHATIQDVIKFIMINLTEKNKISFLLSSIGTIPYFDSGFIRDYYKDHFVYVSLSEKNFGSSFIHEISHVFFYILFNNEGKPFFENDYVMLESYNKAVNASLSNIFLKVSGTSYFEGKTKALFLLHYWYNHHKNHDLLDGSSYLSNVEDELISIFFRQENKLTKEKKLSILKKFYESKNHTDGFSFVMERIYDYLVREDAVKSTEFLVRLPELYSENIDEQIMELFLPARNYWSQYVSPVIENYIYLHFIKCKNFIDQYQSLNNCALPALSSVQLANILDTSASNGCLNCIKNIYRSQTIINKISIDDKKAALLKIVAKIKDWSEFCQSTKDDESNFDCKVQDNFLGSLIEGFSRPECIGLSYDAYNNNIYNEIIGIILNDCLILSE